LRTEIVFWLAGGGEAFVIWSVSLDLLRKMPRNHFSSWELHLQLNKIIVPIFGSPLTNFQLFSQVLPTFTFISVIHGIPIHPPGSILTGLSVFCPANSQKSNLAGG